MNNDQIHGKNISKGFTQFCTLKTCKEHKPCLFTRFLFSHLLSHQCSRLVSPPVVPQTQQVLSSSNPSSGLSGGWDSSVGDSPKAHPHRETPRDTRQPGRTTGVCVLVSYSTHFFSSSVFNLTSHFLQHITSTLSSLSAAWSIDLDSFQSSTPRGQVAFTNIVATLEPSVPRRLLLACHYDSKALPPDPRAPEKVFLGASDSAVPCAMILELATSLDAQLRSFKQQVTVYVQLCLASY